MKLSERIRMEFGQSAHSRCLRKSWSWPGNFVLSFRVSTQPTKFWTLDAETTMHSVGHLPGRDVTLICFLPSLGTGDFLSSRLEVAVVSTVQSWWGFSLCAKANKLFCYETVLMNLIVDIIHCNISLTFVNSIDIVWTQLIMWPPQTQWTHYRIWPEKLLFWSDRVFLPAILIFSVHQEHVPLKPEDAQRVFIKRQWIQGTDCQCFVFKQRLKGGGKEQTQLWRQQWYFNQGIKGDQLSLCQQLSPSFLSLSFSTEANTGSNLGGRVHPHFDQATGIAWHHSSSHRRLHV